MDLRGSNIATGLAALRHELRLRQANAGRDQLPLHIIPGFGENSLARAVTDLLKAQGVPSVCEGASGMITVPPQAVGAKASTDASGT